jgi:hypothetical protein
MKIAPCGQSRQQIASSGTSSETEQCSCGELHQQKLHVGHSAGRRQAKLYCRGREARDGEMLGELVKGSLSRGADRRGHVRTKNFKHRVKYQVSSATCSSTGILYRACTSNLLRNVPVRTHVLTKCRCQIRALRLGRAEVEGSV